MNTKAYKDKLEAQKEQVQAQIDKLKAQMKEAGADARIIINQKIDRLQGALN